MKHYRTIGSDCDKFNFDTIKGIAIFFDNRTRISASAEAKDLLPKGAKRGFPTESYYSIKNPSFEQIAEFLHNISTTK